MRLLAALLSLFVCCSVSPSYALDPSSLLLTCNLIHDKGTDYMRFAAPLTRCGTDTNYTLVIGKSCVNSYFENRVGNFGFTGSANFTPDGFTNYQVSRLYFGLTKLDPSSTEQPSLSKVASSYLSGIKVTGNPFTVSATVSDYSSTGWRYTTASCVAQFLYSISR